MQDGIGGLGVDSAEATDAHSARSDAAPVKRPISRSGATLAALRKSLTADDIPEPPRLAPNKRRKARRKKQGSANAIKLDAAGSDENGKDMGAVELIKTAKEDKTKAKDGKVKAKDHSELPKSKEPQRDKDHVDPNLETAPAVQKGMKSRKRTEVRRVTSETPNFPSESSAITILKRGLIELIQGGTLSSEQQKRALRRLRSTQLINKLEQPEEIHFSLKDALLRAQPEDEMLNSNPEHATTESPHLTKPRRRKPSAKAARGLRGATKGMPAHEIKTINPDDLDLVPFEREGPTVPGLSYGLERVLFNPGVYHLQDPRSRVFNFDPYLQTIMPVSEFDFNALKQYITSSRDKDLLATALETKKKYTGSTSSMTSALSHFHYLISQWRPINTGTLSQMFPVEYNTFTVLSRAPSPIFLRWKDGVYAIDADKEFDTANILSMLGKSMEKLLTLSTEDFEKYRKANSDQISEEERNESESFHYTTVGDFLLRSQLDAHDPRLPGTGMFDLKTRAVVSIRMDIEEYEQGRGYEIRNRHGEWESFEREYYDMIRAAFLKYSLQVRMGRMDGIFVAFHNTQRIFGFQYVSLPELDYALHGTDDTTIGDSEFKLSLELLNRVLDRATTKYPNTSIRLHFETRPASTPFMYIFAEPVEEEEVEKIQATNKAKIEDFERRVLGLISEDASEEQRQAEWDNLRAEVEQSMQRDELGPEASGAEDEHPEAGSEELESDTDGEADELLSLTSLDDEARNSEEDEDDTIMDEEATCEDNPQGLKDIYEDDDLKEDQNGLDESRDELKSRDASKNNEDEAAAGNGESSELAEHRTKLLPVEDANLEENGDLMPGTAAERDNGDIDASTPATETEALDVNIGTTSPKDVFAMTLTIRNKVNGEYVERPERIDKNADWTVEYALAEIDTGSTRKLYAACKERRKQALGLVKNKSQNAKNNLYIANIKKLARRGRQRREQLDKAEAELPIKTLHVKNGKQANDEDKRVSKDVDEVGLEEEK